MSEPRFGLVTVRPDKGCECCGRGDERVAWWHRCTVRIFPYWRGLDGEWQVEGYGFTARSARRDALRRIITEKP